MPADAARRRRLPREDSAVARDARHWRRSEGRPAVPALGGSTGQGTRRRQCRRRSARALPASAISRVWSLPHYNKVVQVPGLLLVLNEFNASYRQIFTDARPLPPDPNPSWTGYSSARWEGDTLVVDSIGFRDDLWLDMAGNTMTSAAKMRERIRRPSFGRLEIELTIDDPKAYTRPWTVTIPMDHAVDVELLEEMCLENEKFGPKMDGNKK